jgi:hypothetical protein
MKHYRETVRRINVIHRPIRGCLGAANPPLKQGIEGPLYVAGSERPPVVKFHAWAEMEYVSERIWDFPTLRQSRLNVKIIVACTQVIEKQLIDSLGLPIQPDSWIQVSGAVFDNHHQGIGIRSARAAEYRNKD